MSDELRRILDPDVLGYYYNTEEGGNIAKLFFPFATSIDSIRSILAEIEAGRHVETASGYSLDLLGKQYGLGRLEDENDEDFRLRIRLEILILISGGTVEDVREILSLALNIEPASVWIHFNESPSQGLTDLPFFVEVSIVHGALLLSETRPWFKFSDSATVRATASELGFNVGQWLGRSSTKSEFLAEINALLERILGAGVQYLIAARGGFRFSVDPDNRTLASDRGFGNGKWRGIISA